VPYDFLIIYIYVPRVASQARWIVSLTWIRLEKSFLAQPESNSGLIKFESINSAWFCD